jgi:hypothetical protein
MRYILKEEVDGLSAVYRIPGMQSSDIALLDGSYASRRSAQAAMRRIMREVSNTTVTIVEVK